MKKGYTNHSTYKFIRIIFQIIHPMTNITMESKYKRIVHFDAKSHLLMFWGFGGWGCLFLFFIIVSCYSSGHLDTIYYSEVLNL